MDLFAVHAGNRSVGRLRRGVVHEGKLPRVASHKELRDSAECSKERLDFLLYNSIKLNAQKVIPVVSADRPPTQTLLGSATAGSAGAAAFFSRRGARAAAAPSPAGRASRSRCGLGGLQKLNCGEQQTHPSKYCFTWI